MNSVVTIIYLRLSVICTQITNPAGERIFTISRQTVQCHKALCARMGETTSHSSLV